MWQSPKDSGSPKEIATPVCALARNDILYYSLHKYRKTS